MTNDSSQRIRLDEILVREGLISEEQIKEALIRQKAHGGKLGSQLLYHRDIDEAGLVHALAIQFDCEGVVLSGLEIPEVVTRLIKIQVEDIGRELGQPLLGVLDFLPQLLAAILAVSSEEA